MQKDLESFTTKRKAKKSTEKLAQKTGIVNPQGSFVIKRARKSSSTKSKQSSKAKTKSSTSKKGTPTKPLTNSAKKQQAKQSKKVKN